LAHVYCGQMAGWIKMPLRMEVGLGPGHVVLDGDPAPPPPTSMERDTAAPHCLGFWMQYKPRPMSVVAK